MIKKDRDIANKILSSEEHEHCYHWVWRATDSRCDLHKKYGYFDEDSSDSVVGDMENKLRILKASEEDKKVSEQTLRRKREAHKYDL